MPTSIAPWLSVRNSKKAVEFYKKAFGAAELFRLEDPDGNVVARLSIDGAEFWVSEESPEHGHFSPEGLEGTAVRMLIITNDPDALFNKAVKNGSQMICDMIEEHGWRSGRLVDPFGHSWEIGQELRK